MPSHSVNLTIPDSGELDVEPELYLPYEPNPQYEPEPEWDQWTQELLQSHKPDAGDHTVDRA